MPSATTVVQVFLLFFVVPIFVLFTALLGDFFSVAAVYFIFFLLWDSFAHHTEEQVNKSPRILRTYHRGLPYIVMFLNRVIRTANVCTRVSCILCMGSPASDDDMWRPTKRIIRARYNVM